MSYQLMIRPFGGSAMSVFQYATLDETLSTAEQALQDGYLRSPKLSIVLGPGSLLSVMSDEEAQAVARDEQAATKSGGLVQLERRTVTENDFVLHVQIGMQSLPPFVFPDRDSLDAAVKSALDAGQLRYVFREEHDYFFLKLGSGMMLFSLDGKEFLAQRREALARQMQQQAAQAGRRIIQPGR